MSGLKQYPEAYTQFLYHFHRTRDFFECHELLEAYWKDHPDSPHKGDWHGLIQVAVGLYHERRGNRRGAVKMLESAVQRLKSGHIERLGIAREPFLSALDNRVAQLRGTEAKRYEDINIPITDVDLVGFVNPPLDSTEAGEDIIHKHVRRDRTDVIAARHSEWIKRRSNR